MKRPKVTLWHVARCAVCGFEFAAVMMGGHARATLDRRVASLLDECPKCGASTKDAKGGTA